jgi:hypothetical protein
MKPIRFIALICGATLCGSTLLAQDQTPKVVLCDESTPTCTHQYIDGKKFKILTADQVVITAYASANTKYARVDLSVLNKTTMPIDVLPQNFSISELTPKERTFAYVPFEKIVKSDEHRAGWANALNAFGAGMATKQVTTDTTSNGTVDLNSSDGTYTNGTYSGTSTSTTSVPDYAAQAQAQENIRNRNAAIAAESQVMSQAALKANSVMPNQAISGVVYFEFDKKVETLQLILPIGGITYEIPFTMTWKH